jgi:hypothetical protein
MELVILTSLEVMFQCTYWMLQVVIHYNNLKLNLILLKLGRITLRYHSMLSDQKDINK